MNVFGYTWACLGTSFHAIQVNLLSGSNKSQDPANAVVSALAFALAVFPSNAFVDTTHSPFNKHQLPDWRANDMALGLQFIKLECDSPCKIGVRGHLLTDVPRAGGVLDGSLSAKADGPVCREWCER